MKKLNKQKWEYKIIKEIIYIGPKEHKKVVASIKEAEKDFNDLGKEGWELFDSLSINLSEKIFIFRRRR